MLAFRLKKRCNLQKKYGMASHVNSELSVVYFKVLKLITLTVQHGYNEHQGTRNTLFVIIRVPCN
jgi:hypothetical protein